MLRPFLLRLTSKALASPGTAARLLRGVQGVRVVSAGLEQRTAQMAEDDSDRPMSDDEVIASAQQIVDQLRDDGARAACPLPCSLIR